MARYGCLEHNRNVTDGMSVATDSERSFGPLLEPAKWCRLLSEEGFQAEVTVLEDFPQQPSSCSVFVATAKQYEPSSAELKLSIFDDGKSSALTEQVIDLTNTYEDLSGIVTGQSELGPSQQVSVILDTSQESLLGRCDKYRFRRLLDFILGNKTVIWVTRGGGTGKDSSMVDGLSRTVRSENPHLQLFTVGLLPDSDDDISALHVVSTIKGILDKTVALDSVTTLEYEYQESEGCLHIPRVTEDYQATVALLAASGRAEPSQQLFNQTDRPLRLVVDTPGIIDSLLFTDHTECKGPLGDDEILLEVRAVGVNFRDLMVALGQLQASTRMGGECSGIVRAVGVNYRDIFQLGDRVVTWGTHIAYASTTKALGAMTRHIPCAMGFPTAASIPIAFTTAWYALVDKAKLSRGNNVLIHSAAGGVGQAAIQIALHLGASVFATVGSDHKRAFLREHYGLDDGHIFSSRNAQFANAIMRSTSGRGVDAVLNSLTGDLLQKSMSCLSTFGTFIEIGKRDILANSRMEMKAFESTRTFTAVNMLDIFDHDPRKGGDLLQHVLELFRVEDLRAIESVTVRPMTEIVETFRALQSGKHIGKFVLEAGLGMRVRATEPKPQSPNFHADGCYIVSGGLGGLGRQICQWIVSCGARHVVTLSRRIPKDVDAFKETLHALGGELMPLQCDISEQNEVLKAVGICVEAFRMVHGLFQASMALDDTIFESMTAQSFLNALSPKVAGTIHLANALRRQSLDFFVMLSSLVGVIGNKAQGNYAAGSTFQDGFANMMMQAGLPALSINLGAVDSAGYVSERPEVLQSLIRKGLTPVKLETFLALLSHGITRLRTEHRASQLLIGLPESAQQADYEDWALQDAKFASLLSTAVTREQGKRTSARLSVRDALREVANQIGAESLLCQRVIQRTAALLNIEPSEIQPEANMTKLGIDSLIAVELRNWINQECGCQISVLQLLDATSIKALSASIFASSSLTKDLRQAGPKHEQTGAASPAKSQIEGVAQGIAIQPPLRTINGASHTKLTEEQSLASLPVPSLEDTCGRLFSSIEVVLDTAAVEKIRNMIQEFLAPDSFGRTLQKRLLERAEQQPQGNWLTDIWVSREYLELRCPLAPNTSFFALLANPERGQNMLGRAALICTVVQQFEGAVINGDLTADILGGIPQDMECYMAMFRRYRVPCVGTDVLCESKVGGARHIVVLWRGYCFRLAMPQADGHSAKLYWQTSLAAVLRSEPEDGGNNIGSLTAWNRDGWANARQAISDTNASNQTFLDTIDNASFILCLDDAALEDTEAMARQLWIGNASNRWYDKPLQFIVFSNGHSGFVGEHSVLDGRPILRLLDSVTAAITASDTEVDAPPPIDNNVPQNTVEPLLCELDPSLYSSIEQSHADFKTHIASQQIIHFQYYGLGQKALDVAKLSANTVGHLIQMLAATEYFGKLVPAYDPISIGHVPGGRYEKCRLATHATKHFIKFMRTDSVSTEAKRESLYAAARAHTVAVADVRAGKGVDGHLCGLRAMVREREEMPPLLKDKDVGESVRGFVSMSYMETKGLRYGFGPVVDEGWGFGLMVFEERLEWMGATRLNNEEMSKVKRCILSAAASIRECLE